MMSRPMLLVFLLLILIITSQFEWKQQLVFDLDTTPSISQKQQHTSNREEAVKEKEMISFATIGAKTIILVKTVGGSTIVYLLMFTAVITMIILSQEKNIQRLNELVRNLREQLRLCRGNKGTANGTVSPLTGNVIELEW